MKLDIVWEKPITLKHSVNESLTYTISLDKLPEKPGIYIFARHWGKSYEALYVGKSNNLRGRINGHLNNLKLMKHIENAKNGKRVIIIGQPHLRPGHKIDTVLPTLERAFIRHFLSEGHDLVNKQGVRIRRHEINSGGIMRKSFIPAMMYLEMR
jgi:hypothetical protein